MYIERTNDIVVEVQPSYLAEHSDPELKQYLFAYRVKITNLGTQSVVLQRRHWITIDGNGQVNEISGEGVIGEKPRIDPGQCFHYSSGCPLGTPTGNMRGHYLLAYDDGTRIKARIPLFFLRHPDTFH